MNKLETDLEGTAHPYISAVAYLVAAGGLYSPDHEVAQRRGAVVAGAGHEGEVRQKRRLKAVIDCLPTATKSSRSARILKPYFKEIHALKELPDPALSLARASQLIGTGLRFARLGLHFVRAWVELVCIFAWLAPGRRASRVQAWCQAFLRIARLHVKPHGPLDQPPGALMLVANHVSWLDMVVLQSVRPCSFVAKSEVRAWPLIGTVATRCGTVYLERAHARSAAGVAMAITALLRMGRVLTLFPEGTTTDGTSVQPFHGGLLQGAIDAGAAVQPVGLRYLEAGTGLLCRRVSYTGGDTLLGSMWRTLSQETTVCVSFGSPVPATSRKRRELASELHVMVVALNRRDRRP